VSAEAVVLTAYFHPHEDKFEQALDAIASSLDAIHSEAGCLRFALHRSESTTSILAIEQWESAEALEGHNNGSARQQLREALQGLVAKPTDVTVFSPVPAGGPAGVL
jgi:quinol monooxygenase YgiN